MPENCAVCDIKEYRTVLRFDKPDVYERAAGVGLDGYWREWVACAECGFHYSRYSRSPDVFESFYTKGYRQDQASWRGESSIERFRKIAALPPAQSETQIRIDWIVDQCERLREWPESGRMVLDVGGASGVFAGLFSKREWNCTVVDPSVEGKFIETDLGIPYIACPIGEAEVLGEFHLVSMNYVLEHLLDPLSTLEGTKKALRPDGLLFIEVPDASNFKHLPLDHDIFNACHLWMFDCDSLGGVLERAGYRLLVTETLDVLRGHKGLMVLAEQCA
jgi:SAM-dependent methyltransferase